MVAAVAVAVVAHLIERGVCTSTEAVVAIGSSSTDHHGTMTPSSGLVRAKGRVSVRVRLRVKVRVRVRARVRGRARVRVSVKVVRRTSCSATA